MTNAGAWDSLLPQQPAGPDPFFWQQNPGGGQQAETWWQGGGQQANTWGTYATAQGGWNSTMSDNPFFHTDAAEADDLETDSDTSLDDMPKDNDDPGISQMTSAQAAEHLFYQYRRARRHWRRFKGKPTRLFRHFVKRAKGCRKGRGKRFFWTQDDTTAYLARRGKGNRKGSGKGFGSKKSPTDKAGDVMRCRTCNSDEHFAKHCPQNRGGSGQD